MATPYLPSVAGIGSTCGAGGKRDGPARRMSTLLEQIQDPDLPQRLSPAVPACSHFSCARCDPRDSRCRLDAAERWLQFRLINTPVRAPSAVALFPAPASVTK